MKKDNKYAIETKLIGNPIAPSSIRVKQGEAKEFYPRRSSPPWVGEEGDANVHFAAEKFHQDHGGTGALRSYQVDIRRWVHIPANDFKDTEDISPLTRDAVTVEPKVTYPEGTQGKAEEIKRAFIEIESKVIRAFEHLVHIRDGDTFVLKSDARFVFSRSLTTKEESPWGALHYLAPAPKGKVSAGVISLNTDPRDVLKEVLRVLHLHHY